MFVCTLHGWIYTALNQDMDIILKVLGVFARHDEAVRYAQSYTLDDEQWIEIHEFHGTERRSMGEIDNTGFSECL